MENAKEMSWDDLKFEMPPGKVFFEVNAKDPKNAMFCVCQSLPGPNDILRITRNGSDVDGEFIPERETIVFCALGMDQKKDRPIYRVLKSGNMLVWVNQQRGLEDTRVFMPIGHAVDAELVECDNRLIHLLERASDKTEEEFWTANLPLRPDHDRNDQPSTNEDGMEYPCIRPIDPKVQAFIGDVEEDQDQLIDTAFLSFMSLSPEATKEFVKAIADSYYDEKIQRANTFLQVDRTKGMFDLVEGTPGYNDQERTAFIESFYDLLGDILFGWPC